MEKDTRDIRMDKKSVHWKTLAEVRQLKVFSFFSKNNMVDSNQSEAIQ